MQALDIVELQQSSQIVSRFWTDSPFSGERGGKPRSPERTRDFWRPKNKRGCKTLITHPGPGAVSLLFVHAAVAAALLFPIAVDAAPPIPPPPALAHPISTDRGVKFTVPLSVALTAPDGSAFYTRDVNRFVCVADDSKSRLTWLGYGLGVKVLDHKAGVVRHYGEREGLPAGQVQAIAADTSGQSWCVVRGEPEFIRLTKPSYDPESTGPIPAGTRVQIIPLYLCHFQPTTGRWTVLYKRLSTREALKVITNYSYTAADSYGANQMFLENAGSPHITVSKDSVTFGLGMAAPADTMAVYQWDRRTRLLRTIPWETGMRFDNPALFTTFLATDQKNGGLWIGTNAGLLFLPKAAPGVPRTAATAKRVILDKVIGEGAATADGGVWVTAVPRAVGEDRYRTAAVYPWQVYRITGTGAKQIRDVTPDAEVIAPLRRKNPVAVTVKSDGSLWLTQKALDFTGDYPFGPSFPAGWWRLNPKTGKWTQFDGAVPARTPQDIPDAAVRPLALQRLEQKDYVTVFGEVKENYGQRPDINKNTVTWLWARFPEWICPDDLGKTFGDPQGFLLERHFSPAPPSRPVPDPYGPSGSVWATDTAGTTLLHLPRLSVSETDPSVERYPLPKDRTFPIHPPVGALSAEKKGGSRLYLKAGGKTLLTYDTTSRTFSNIPLQKPVGYTSADNPPIVTEEGAVIVSTPGWPQYAPLRYDPRDGSVRVLTAAGGGNRVFGAAPNGGLWIWTPENKIQFLEPGAAAPEPIPVELIGPDSQARQHASATGFIAWSLPGGDVVLGYDWQRKRRTPTLNVTNPRGGSSSRRLKVIDDGIGGAYVASEKPGVGVSHYDRERNEWKTIAPPPPVLPVKPGESANDYPPLLASVTDSEIWLVANYQYLVRFDRRKGTWDESIRLPSVLQDGVQDFSITPAENGKALYAGGNYGLWRFDRGTGAWAEVTQRISAAELATAAPDAPESIRALLVLVTPQDIFTVWKYKTSTLQFVGRLERATRKWTLYDEFRGFGDFSYDFDYPLAVGGGGSLWLRHSGQAFVLDRTRDLWRSYAAPTHFNDSKRAESTSQAPRFYISDLDADPRTGDTFLLAQTIGADWRSRSFAVFRCDANGTVVGRSVAGPGVIEDGRFSLFADGGSTLIATYYGVWRAFGTDSGKWERETPPAGLPLPTEVRHFEYGPDGKGLYLMGSDTVSYWASYSGLPPAR